jgi:hypothetical protein
VADDEEDAARIAIVRHRHDGLSGWRHAGAEGTVPSRPLL